MYNLEGLENSIRGKLHGFTTFSDCCKVFRCRIFRFATAISYFLWLLRRLCRCSFGGLTMQSVFTLKRPWVLQDVDGRTTDLNAVLTA